MTENNLDPSLQRHDEYIGDGVYVHDEGHMIVLKANHHEHPTDTVCVEESVFKAMVRWVNRTHPEWIERMKND